MLGKTEGKRRRGDEGWDGWMASPTQCPWVWANSRRWWRTGKPGVLQTMGLRRLGHDWATEQQQREREAETGISLRKLCQVCSTTIAKRYGPGNLRSREGLQQDHSEGWVWVPCQAWGTVDGIWLIPRKDPQVRVWLKGLRPLNRERHLKLSAVILASFPGGSDDKASACNAGDPGSVPGSGRSPGEGNATHSSTLAWRISPSEEPGRLQSTGSQKSQTRLGN